jgi:hypothetical protein
MEADDGELRDEVDRRHVAYLSVAYAKWRYALAVTLCD